MIFSRSRFAGTKMYVGSPSAAPAAAVAPARLPVEAHASASYPSSTDLAAATATTRSLNEWVGFEVSVLTYSSQSRPSSAASRSARISGEFPTGSPRAGASTGRNAARRQRLQVEGRLQRAEAAVTGEQRVERMLGSTALAAEMGCVHEWIPLVGPTSSDGSHLPRPSLAGRGTVSVVRAVAEASQGRIPPPLWMRVPGSPDVCNVRPHGSERRARRSIRNRYRSSVILDLLVLLIVAA